MKVLSAAETKAVVGGAGDVARRGVELCRGLPDNSNVRITVQNTDSFGIGSTNGSRQETMTFTLTCGQLRKALDDEKVQPKTN